MELYDLHTHTFLSDCASKTNANPVDYVKAAEENGLLAIGFSDHSWDASIEGASPWYKKQPFERLETTRELLDGYESSTEIKILFGAETEYAGGVLGVGEHAASRLDYVIVPHSHTHMKGFVLPEGCDTPEKHAAYLIKSFYEVCTHKKRSLFFGIAHPMFPVGLNREEAERVYSYISDRDMCECLYAAKENGIFLELNTSVISKIDESDLQNSFYARFFGNAKRVGNAFFMGSDKHSVIPSGKPDAFMKIGVFAKKLGLTPSDFKAALDYVRAL